MKKTLAILVSLFLVGIAVYVGRAVPPLAPDEESRAAALKLYKSLTDEQKKLAVKEFSDKDRYTERFTPGARPGLSVKSMTKEQKAMLDDVLTAMTSDYGAKRCLQVVKLDENDRYLNFFGEPSADKPFAWRLAMHHMTLIYAEYGKDKADEFGPILLGGNPVKDIWIEEEKIAIELFGYLTDAEAKKIQAPKETSPTSGSAIGKAGIKIGDLNEKSRDLARKLLAKRLDVFSADRKKAAQAVIDRDGGVDSLRIAFWNRAEKPNAEGGNYHWRIGNDAFLADWQSAGKSHVHMTLRGKAKPAVK